MTIIRICQKAVGIGEHAIDLTLKRPGQADLEGYAKIEFGLTPQEQEELRWYMEDYLQRADSVEEVQVEQIEAWMKQRGEELYNKVLDANQNTRAIWFAVREHLADLRIEITTGIVEAVSIPWELMRDSQSDSAIALRVQAFVRVQSDPNTAFIPVPAAADGRLRLLYAVCRPGGRNDVELRAVANRLLQDLGADLARFEISALRPPTFEQLQKELTDAKQAGHPFHIVHFDGHGCYADLSETSLADWLKAINALTLGGKHNGKHGYLLFEHPGSKENMRPVSGGELGKLLHDTGVPVLVLNACQSAMHEATGKSEKNLANSNVHDEVRVIGSLAQAVIDQGIPGVLGMRYSVFVVTAAQYIGQVYAALAQGRSFGQAASEGRKHLALNPDRWVGLRPRPLQDWFVPVVYEAAPIHLLPTKAAAPSLQLDQRPELDPVQINPVLRRYVPDTGFVGRDETLLLLDRAFDEHPAVLLRAYAGQGKSATAVEFARWYAQTGGLGAQPFVLWTSFETHTGVTDLLNQTGHTFAAFLRASGIEWHALNDPAKRRSLVLQILQQIPVLWVWDNVELVAGFPDGTESAWTPEEQADLADFLKQIKLDRATQARILLTSRRNEEKWLGGIPHRVEMPRMKNSDAASLARSLGSERKITRSEIADWQLLLDYCNGNPLTLRVIVGQAIRMGLRGQEQIGNFVEAIRSGEQAIEDADEKQGRDKSLGASLNYGFQHAFKKDELPVIALAYLFQQNLDVRMLHLMGSLDSHFLPELRHKTTHYIASLLERASDIGLLTDLGDSIFSIHPALPWFLRQLFASSYDGQSGRSSSEAAIRAWVEALGGFGSHFHNLFTDGEREVIRLIEMNEINLVRACRLARQHNWWNALSDCVLPLRDLYEYQGRDEDLALLVAEITPCFCSSDDAPISGREFGFVTAMGHRIHMAQHCEMDLTKAANLLSKLIAWCRAQLAPILKPSKGSKLDDRQKNQMRNLAVTLATLGQVKRQQGLASDCLKHYQESLRFYQRIGESVGQAVTEGNVGNAYLSIPEIRDFSAAEAAFRRSLALRDTNDSLGKARSLEGIGLVNVERFSDGIDRKDSHEKLLHYALQAETNLLAALDLFPAGAINDRTRLHHQIGSLYARIGNLEGAREHSDQAIHLSEQTGNHLIAGSTRLNVALMHALASENRAIEIVVRCNYLKRAQSYAEAALRNFQQYQGRAVNEEAKTQRIIGKIKQALIQLHG